MAHVSDLPGSRNSGLADRAGQDRTGAACAVPAALLPGARSYPAVHMK